MADLSKETLQRLHEAATPGPWTGYSEPEVGLPYSLFAGTPMVSGFGPVEPMMAADIDLVALLRNSVPAILKLLDENAAMREALAELEAAASTVVEAIDSYNAENGTALCGGALFGIAKALAPARAALANQENTHG